MTEPLYLDETQTTEESVRQRMLEAVPSDIDKAEGSYIWDSINPAAIELALAAIMAQEVLRKGFASTAASNVAGEITAELDERVNEHGLTRRAAVKATGQVTFTGTIGTVIAAGTRVATPASSDVSSIEFITLAEVTVSDPGSASAEVEAVEAGASGNVATGAISLLVTPVAGISGVSNATATTGGLDTEDDISLLERYLQKVSSPSAGGNKADYANWALEVSGVGGVSVVPVRDGPGTVSIAVINSNKQAASQALVDSVQAYIAPAWEHITEAEAMTLGGSGTSVDDTQPDASGESVKMVYDVAGAGTLTHVDLESFLDQPGIWQVRPLVKVDDNAGVNDLLQVGIYNVSTAAWAQTTAGGGTDALITLQASDLSTVFTEQNVEFYWTGQDQLELRITRLQADNATIVWMDLAAYRSTFSKDTGEGKAPIGARVKVESATAVPINVSATLTIVSGYNADSVKAAAEQNVAAYIKSLAFADNNDVLYVRVGSAILDTEGVGDYSNLLVNNGAANISIGNQEVAVKGTVTFD